MATTHRVTQETARRVLSVLAAHGGDINAAAHDVNLGIVSLGGYYTDRKSEAALTVLRRLQQQEQAGHVETVSRWRQQLAAIAAGETVNA